MVRVVSYLGNEGRLEFLESVRLRMDTISGQELLYNDARGILASVIRSERPEEESQAWADVFNRVDALAEATEVSTAEDRDAYLAMCQKTSVRFRTLAHLLRDNMLFTTVYNREGVLELPFVSRIISWLRGMDEAKLSGMKQQLELPEVNLRIVVNILAQCRLLDWREEENEIFVSLTDTGRQYAVQL